ncbi:xanthine dehydrogenase accessory factor [Sedimentibacter acidaminivorans]|uniref:Xanthine dehydrogenase accessory factor n=1 Tax=Sedimentibacter acidaminivorans TaxID=913099 RepID=A0ABS4GDK4_9FIRM|nr:selenium-dependent molybdenum cofactor biosynthesis protein YqeB [Sedimentibacter acidaminivorans]MBP1925769.1 xanthine dehydrogenase accessory factor [Sedimentibacter acidaminivorans]
MKGDIIVVKGGGDVASGSIQKLHRSGFRVLVLEIENPTSIRRTVCFSEAIFNGEMSIEGIKSVYVKNEEEVLSAWKDNNIPVMIDPKGVYIDKLKPIAVVDAIIAKKNTGMKKDIAPITIAIGPGFEAGKDVDIVVESNRGHNLGKLIFSGYADENTGNPGNIEGFTIDRVLYSPCEGVFKSNHKIGDVVKTGEVVASVNGKNIYAKIDGLIRGLIRSDTLVTEGFKVGDVDPRVNQINNCFTISDKARAIGGAVLEAVMISRNKFNYEN